MLHQLTARAVINDWEDGSLHADKYEHEVRTLMYSYEHEVRTLMYSYEHDVRTLVHSYISRSISVSFDVWQSIRFKCEHANCFQILKKQMKADVIKLSVEHCIVTQFTSFIAVEQRHEVSVEHCIVTQFTSFIAVEQRHEVSVKHCIVTQFTSFIAVEQRHKVEFCCAHSQ